MSKQKKSVCETLVLNSRASTSFESRERKKRKENEKLKELVDRSGVVVECTKLSRPSLVVVEVHCLLVACFPCR